MKKYLLKDIAFGSIIVASVLIVLLTVLVHFHPVMNFDVIVSRDLQAEGSTAFERNVLYHTLAFISYIGRTTVAVWIVLGFSLLFWASKYYLETLFCLLTPISAIINSAIKLLINRPRPEENLVNILDHQLSPSYPSGHVVFFTVFFGFLIAAMFFVKRIPFLFRMAIGLMSLLLISLVSVSRVYLGAHWVTDVIAGYLLGIILLSILLYYYLKNYTAEKT